MNQDIKKREKPVHTLMYDDGKRILMAFVFLVIIALGIALILLNQWVTLFFGGFLVFVGFIRFLDICFFKRLTIGKTRITKEWFYFGKQSIKLSDLQVGVVKRLWSGIIFFQHKDRIGLDRFTMQFEVFPIGNSGFNLIRNILIQKRIISGDELSWKN